MSVAIVPFQDLVSLAVRALGLNKVAVTNVVSCCSRAICQGGLVSVGGQKRVQLVRNRGGLGVLGMIDGATYQIAIRYGYSQTRGIVKEAQRGTIFGSIKTRCFFNKHIIMVCVGCS